MHMPLLVVLYIEFWALGLGAVDPQTGAAHQPLNVLDDVYVAASQAGPLKLWSAPNKVGVMTNATDAHPAYVDAAYALHRRPYQRVDIHVGDIVRRKDSRPFHITVANLHPQRLALTSYALKAHCAPNTAALPCPSISPFYSPCTKDPVPGNAAAASAATPVTPQHAVAAGGGDVAAGGAGEASPSAEQTAAVNTDMAPQTSVFKTKEFGSEAPAGPSELVDQTRGAAPSSEAAPRGEGTGGGKERGLRAIAETVERDECAGCGATAESVERGDCAGCGAAVDIVERGLWAKVPADRKGRDSGPKTNSPSTDRKGRGFGPGTNSTEEASALLDGPSSAPQASGLAEG
ncbi:hypothetical protein DUNSADRAFT_2286, partial [Dunaliella salina]